MASAAVLIPNPLLSARLAAVLRTMGFAPVHEGVDIGELKHCAADPPDLLLIKLQQPDSGVILFTEEIRLWAPLAKVVFLAPALNLATLIACFAGGAAGYLTDDISRAGLRYSLRLVAAGEKVFPSALAGVLSNRENLLKFSQEVA